MTFEPEFKREFDSHNTKGLKTSQRQANTWQKTFAPEYCQSLHIHNYEELLQSNEKRQTVWFLQWAKYFTGTSPQKVFKQPVNILISINLTTQFIENERQNAWVTRFFRTYFLSVQWQHSTSQRSILADLNVVFFWIKVRKRSCMLLFTARKEGTIKEQTFSSFSTYISHPNILWGRGWRVREKTRGNLKTKKQGETGIKWKFIFLFSSLIFHSSKYIPCFSR